MKLVKVQRHWKLAEAGMSVAFRFDRYDSQAQEITVHLESIYGPQPVFDYKIAERWKTHFGRYTDRNGSPYFIGLRDPADASLILLFFAHKNG